MITRLTALGVLCIAVATLAGQSGQAPSDAQSSGDAQQPTFVAGTQFVRVDVYVTRDGQQVTDLRPDEITLLEDGVPQTIDTFERIVFRAPDPLEPALEPRTLEESRRLAADPRSRVFVVFIDPWHTSYVNPVAPERAAMVQRDFPVLRRLEAVLGPDDLVAVMTPKMRPEEISFGRGTAGLAELEGEWVGPYSIIRPDPGHAMADDETELLYLTCYPDLREGPAPEMIARRRERMAFDALETLASYLGALREERKSVLLVTDGWRMFEPNPRLMERGREAPAQPLPPIGGRGRQGGGPITLTERGVFETDSADWQRCESDRISLAALDHTWRLDGIIDRANQNNVSFYPVSVRGVATGPSSLVGPSMLRELAEETGGYAVVNTNNFETGIERLMSDSAAFYLIGYESTNRTLDGSYRRIQVRVSRPGVDVRARPGYVASAPAPATSSMPVEPARLDPVAAALRDVAAIDARAPLQLRGAAWSAATADGHAGGFWIVGDLDAQTRRQKEWMPGVTAEVVVLNAGGEELLTRRTDVPAVGPAFALRVPETGTLSPGDYTVRVLLQGTARLARISDTTLVTIPSDTQPLGDPVLWRRGPSTGQQQVQTAFPHFRRNERLRLEVPVLSDAAVTARLLDRNGSALAIPVTVTERTDPGEPFRWAVLDLVLSPLAAGDYVVEATQDGTTRHVAFKLVP